MRNNELFFNLYNTLDKLLRRHYNVDDVNQSVIVKRINELKNSTSAFKRARAEKLDIIRNLRNSLAHIEKFNNEENFIIKSTLIKALKDEIRDVLHPLTAKDIYKNIDEVMCANLNDNVKDVINKMIDKGYSHIPVVLNDKLVGVFSENTIFTALSESDHIDITSNSLIKDYLPFINIENHSSQYFLFVKESMLVDDLYLLFNKKKNNKKLVMAFVSKNGSIKDNILGIITSYELLKH